LTLLNSRSTLKPIPDQTPYRSYSMKVSKEKKAETRRQIVRAAAEHFVNQGFDATTMKQIAKTAGIGDATVYKYFPNKDKLVLGFYEVCAEDALENYRQVEDLESYTFAEKLQLLVDTLLEQLISDREFVELSLTQLLKSPVSLFRDQLQVPLPTLLSGLLTDYLMMIVFYWIKDDSEEFSNTTQFCDLSVSMIDSVLQSGVMNKALDVLSFFIKHHLLRGLSSSGNLLNILKEFQGAVTDK